MTSGQSRGSDFIMQDLGKDILEEFASHTPSVYDTYWAGEGLTLHTKDKPKSSTERMRRYRLRHGAALKIKERAYYKEWKRCKTSKKS